MTTKELNEKAIYDFEKYLKLIGVDIQKTNVGESYNNYYITIYGNALCAFAFTLIDTNEKEMDFFKNLSKYDCHDLFLDFMRNFVRETKINAEQVMLINLPNYLNITGYIISTFNLCTSLINNVVITIDYTVNEYTINCIIQANTFEKDVNLWKKARIQLLEENKDIKEVIPNYLNKLETMVFPRIAKDFFYFDKDKNFDNDIESERNIPYNIYKRFKSDNGTGVIIQNTDI